MGEINIPGLCCSTLTECFTSIIQKIGEDPNRPGLIDTPQRAAKALEFLTSGYKVNLNDIVNGALFPADNQEMVIVRNVEFDSLCEHHVLPFSGYMHVGYIPDNQVIGLSKIPRILDVFARRLQIQENLTKQVADAIKDLVKAKGVYVVAYAKHSCLSMRGVKKQSSSMVTVAKNGVFLESLSLCQEFNSLISMPD